MIRIRTSSFTDLKPSDLTEAAQVTLNAVSSNSLFADIMPEPAVVQSVISDLRNKIAIAKEGTKIQKDERDQTKSILISYLTQWSNFVTMKANAKATYDEQVAVVNASAFEPITRGSRIGMLDAVTGIRTKSLSRAVSISWRATPGAHLYQVMKTSGYANENSVWTEAEITSRVRVTIPCKAAEVVSFIIYPLGSAGRGTKSAIVTCLAGL